VPGRAQARRAGDAAEPGEFARVELKIAQQRLDRGWRSFGDCRTNIKRPPSEYLKRFYFDTVNFDPRALRFAADFAGTSQILAGSDYPHQIGSIEKMLESLKAIKVSEEDRKKILGGNAAKLLG